MVRLSATCPERRKDAQELAQIPAKIYLHIFSFLRAPVFDEFDYESTKIELCQFSLTCRLFHEIAQPAVFKSVKLRWPYDPHCDDESDKERGTIRRFRRPQSYFALAVLHEDPSAMEMVQLVEECSLDLLGHDDRKRCIECTDSLLSILSKFIRLHSLSIDGVLVCPRLIQTLARLPFLQSLSIIHSSEYHTDESCVSPKQSEDETALPILFLETARFRADVFGIEDLSEAHASRIYSALINPNLTVFEVGSWTFAKALFSSIFAFSLQVLKLATIDWHELDVVYRFLESMPSVKELGIHRLILDSINDLPLIARLSTKALPNLPTLECPPCLLLPLGADRPLQKISLDYESLILWGLDDFTWPMAEYAATVLSFAKTVKHLDVPFRLLSPLLGSETFPVLKQLAVTESFGSGQDREESTEFFVSQILSLPSFPSLEDLSFPCLLDSETADLAMQHDIITRITDQYPCLAHCRLTSSHRPYHTFDISWRRNAKGDWYPSFHRDLKVSDHVVRKLVDRSKDFNGFLEQLLSRMGVEASNVERRSWT
ncbi:hypothetical protein C8J56DRAFT_950598 [Mycena floridula]|nr:hypothetical protein C8J56DRAFT_950598 [Mycena floridula]